MGWRVAQERDLMRGWAWEERGEMELSVGGRVEVMGKSVGEMKGGHFNRAISARESMT